MDGRQTFEQFGPALGEGDVELAPVALALLPDDEALRLKAVDQPDDAVVPDL